ncbi:MAG: cation transporter [Chloroflexi bacterium]|nr:cation transporter [Chloroflexota bacterium]
MTADVMGEQVRAGVRVEIVTVVWMVLEAAIGIEAGIAAGSVLLTAFGIDSVIELISGSILLWRLSIQARGGDPERAERAERRSALVVAGALCLLCLYVLGSALHGLLSHAHPERSPVGIGLAAAALIVMPWLAAAKRRIASRIDSGALRGDAASSITCAYMAGTVLAGLVLNAALGWWWAEDVAALAFLVWLAGETWEALEEAREG